MTNSGTFEDKNFALAGALNFRILVLKLLFLNSMSAELQQRI
jgi:hypothetical protein